MERFHTTEKRLLLAIGILVLIFGIVTFAISRSATEREHKANADITKIEARNGVSPFVDMHGRTVSLGDFKGRYIVVSAWASWCTSCKEDLRLLNELSRTYEDVAFLAVNRGEDKKLIESYLKTLDPLDDIHIVQDRADHFFSTVRGYAMPETVIYNSEGDIVRHFRAPLQREVLSGVLESEL